MIFYDEKDSCDFVLPKEVIIFIKPITEIIVLTKAESKFRQSTNYVSL